MKYKILLVFVKIFFISNIFGQFNPDNFNFIIEKDGSTFVISAVYINGILNSPPQTNDELSDLVFAIKFPDTYSNANVTLSVASTDFNIIKNGTIKQGIGFKYQDFALNSPIVLSSNWTLDDPIEVARIQYTITNPTIGDVATLCQFGEINNSLPNINVQFEDFTPSVLGNVSLPITLKSFDAKKHSASSAKLDWTTSKEVNSDYFGIERSIDGSTWDEIARVKAAGDSNLDIAYDYIDDRLPLSRTNGQVFYYRLRMTDLDGAFKYSDVRGVNFDKQALGPISIYPNPTTEIVNIDLSEVVMEDGDVYVSVYDMSGRLVMTKQIIGSGIELIKVDQLPSDAYNFIIRQGEQIHQQRVIKID